MQLSNRNTATSRFLSFYHDSGKRSIHRPTHPSSGPCERKETRNDCRSLKGSRCDWIDYFSHRDLCIHSRVSFLVSVRTLNRLPPCASFFFFFLQAPAVPALGAAVAMMALAVSCPMVEAFSLAAPTSFVGASVGGKTTRPMRRFTPSPPSPGSGWICGGVDVCLHRIYLGYRVYCRAPHVKHACEQLSDVTAACWCLQVGRRSGRTCRRAVVGARGRCRLGACLVLCMLSWRV